MADSPRNLFLPHQNRPKGNPKTIGFWRRSFPHFFRCWKKWGRRRQKPEKSDPRSEARNLPFSLLKEMGPPEAQRESVQRAAAAKSDPRP